MFADSDSDGDDDFDSDDDGEERAPAKSKGAVVRPIRMELGKQYQQNRYVEVVAKIDTRKCPLYMLTGEYDFSCTPEDTRRTAEHIAGAEVTIMERLGHFPMSENPAHFRTYILPVLEKIRALER